MRLKEVQNKDTTDRVRISSIYVSKKHYEYIKKQDINLTKLVELSLNEIMGNQFKGGKEMNEEKIRKEERMNNPILLNAVATACDTMEKISSQNLDYTNKREKL